MKRITLLFLALLLAACEVPAISPLPVGEGKGEGTPTATITPTEIPPTEAAPMMPEVIVNKVPWTTGWPTIGNGVITEAGIEVNIFDESKMPSIYKKDIPEMAEYCFN